MSFVISKDGDEDQFAEWVVKEKTFCLRFTPPTESFGLTSIQEQRWWKNDI